KLEDHLRNAARELGLDLVRNDNDVEITALEETEGENSEPPSSEALRTIAQAVEDFEQKLATVQDEADQELRSGMSELFADAVKACLARVRKRFDGRSDIVGFLGEVEAVVTRQLRLLVDEPKGEESPTLRRGIVVPTLLTEHKPGSGAPVVEVTYPTLSALF